MSRCLPATLSRENMAHGFAPSLTFWALIVARWDWGVVSPLWGFWFWVEGISFPTACAVGWNLSSLRDFGWWACFCEEGGNLLGDTGLEPVTPSV